MDIHGEAFLDEARELLATLEPFEKAAACASFNSDGTLIAAVGAEGAIRIWDSATASRLVSLPSRLKDQPSLWPLDPKTGA